MPASASATRYFFLLNDAMPQMGQHAPKDGVGGSRFYLHVENVDAQRKKPMAAGMTERAAPSDMFWGDRASARRSLRP
jgi:uncharacterized glyoxalase superfamily protein PhnB